MQLGKKELKRVTRRRILNYVLFWTRKIICNSKLNMNNKIYIPTFMNFKKIKLNITKFIFK